MSSPDAVTYYKWSDVPLETVTPMLDRKLITGDTMMIAQVCGLAPGHFIHSFGDAHLYLNHVDQARTQLARTPRALPRVELNAAVNSVFDFRAGDVTLLDYDPHPAIRAPIAV